jgi:hypothetical protein
MAKKNYRAIKAGRSGEKFLKFYPNQVDFELLTLGLGVL